MENENVTKKKEKEVKVKKETKISKILAVLQMKSLKNEKDTLEKLKTLYPTQDEKLLKRQIGFAIRDVNSGKIKGYTWNKELYLLTKNQ